VFTLQTLPDCRPDNMFVDTGQMAASLEFDSDPSRIGALLNEQARYALRSEVRPATIVPAILTSLRSCDLSVRDPGFSGFKRICSAR
jgi:hypothetical protein